jgi:hypothetical protein
MTMFKVLAVNSTRPLEKAQLRVQTDYAKGLVDGLRRLYRSEGLAG